MCDWCGNATGSVYDVKEERQDRHNQKNIGEICEECVFQIDDLLRANIPEGKTENAYTLMQKRNRESVCVFCESENVVSIIKIGSKPVHVCSTHAHKLKNEVTVATPA